MNRELLDAAEVAKITKLRVGRIWELTRKRELPFAVKFGKGQYRYDSQGLADWIAKGGNLNPEEDREQ